MVVEGCWCGKKAAFKFVPIKRRVGKTFVGEVEEIVEGLQKALNESRHLGEAQIDHFVPFYGHYRFVSFILYIISHDLSGNNCILLITCNLQSFSA